MTQEVCVAAREERLESAGGVKIFIRSWRPIAKATGVVAIVHGFNSHSGYYTWVAEQLTSAGLAVYALDLRGRGQSSGERFFIENVSDYISDVESLISLAKSREAGLPVFLLGHSAGGVISCVYTLEHQAELAGFICESFAFQLPGPEAELSVVKGLSHLVPHVHVLKLENQHFSRDPEVVRTLNEDPLLANEVQPTLTVAEMVRADERLKKEFPLITLPVLILHGTMDKVTMPGGSQFFYDHAGSRDKTLKLYEGHYHDLLNDIDKELVMADIQSWIKARVLPS
ncbi:MAG: lysophospholipase [Bryobacteraceae bacterium]|nr:lysophospholipase [Bryobacteraceae bacterium]